MYLIILQHQVYLGNVLITEFYHKNNINNNIIQLDINKKNRIITFIFLIIIYINID